jgi:sugar lactone lactonase YvrE
VSALLFDEDSRPVIACPGGMYALLPAGDRHRLVAIEPDDADRMPNDAACDQQGRVWISTLDRSFRSGEGRLYRVADGKAEILAEDFTIPNGIGFSPDERLMYVADSYRARVDVFDFHAVHGTITNRRCFAEVDPADGFPDGLCVDASGAVWLALFGGGAVRRYSPEGKVTATVDLPVTQVTSCAFGGERMDELFMTTARTGDRRPLNSAELEAQPHAGDIFAVQTGAVGMSSRRAARVHLHSDMPA